MQKTPGGGDQQRGRRGRRFALLALPILLALLACVSIPALPARATGNPPLVGITSPAQNSFFMAVPATINISASASDSDGMVVRVDFYSGSSLLGTATAAPYTFTWSGVSSGLYTLTAKATDNDGNVTTSTPISLSVRVESCHVTYSVVSWPGGFSSQFSIQNTGTTDIHNWALTFNLFPGQTLTSGWSAVYTQVGTTLTASASYAAVPWNATILAGSNSYSLGFNATEPVTNPIPVAFALNGTPCT